MTTLAAYDRVLRTKGRALLMTFQRTRLRRALWLLRRENARPHEPNPAAAQYESAGITLGMVRAEYRRRGWKVPKASKGEHP